jgi:hypothetical protein
MRIPSLNRAPPRTRVMSVAPPFQDPPVTAEALDDLEDEIERVLADPGSLRHVGPKSHPCEDRLDRVTRPKVEPVLGREVVERGEVVPVAVERLGGPILAGGMEPEGELVAAGLQTARVGADQTSRRRRLASGQSRLGSLSTRFIARWFQQRWWRVPGKTSVRPAHNPRPPSPTARSGATSPRSRRSRSTSAQHAVLSR